MEDLISRTELLKKVREAQDRLQSNDDKIWERNKKYLKGLAWAHRLILEAAAVEDAAVSRKWGGNSAKKEKVKLFIRAEDMPGSCSECFLGERYGCVGDVECHALREYFTGNVKPPYKERPDECPLTELTEKHGHWQGKGDECANGEIAYDVCECSECGHAIDDVTDDMAQLLNFCPNCGARMDGGDSNC